MDVRIPASPSQAAALPPFYRLLGIVPLGESEQGCPMLELRSRPELENSRGDVHGGVLTSLLTAAIGAAVRGAYDPVPAATTASVSVNFVAPGRGRIVAIGEIMRAGESLASAQARVVDDTGRLVAHALGTMKILRPRSRSK
jgi:uncharacterized protein (TIGR00369 family)